MFIHVYVYEINMFKQKWIIISFLFQIIFIYYNE